MSFFFFFQDMTATIKNFRDGTYNKDLKQVDCLVVAIMSHGKEGYDKENSYVVTTDNKVISISWILDQFDNSKCPEMRNKPKIFFLQICRYYFIILLTSKKICTPKMDSIIL